MKNIIALLMFIIISACSPSQPSNVPDDSFWVSDGEAWVKLSDVEQNRFYAIIYHKDGEKWESGWFAYLPPPKDVNPPKTVNADYIQKYMSSFNGQELTISDIASGRVLIYKIQK